MRETYYRQYYRAHYEKIRAQQAIYRATHELKPKKQGEDLYLSRKENQEAEERGEGKINWKCFDRLVEKTKEDIIEEVSKLNNHKMIKRYIYNLYGQKIFEGSSIELEKKLYPFIHVRKENITKYCNNEWIKDCFFFSNVNYNKLDRLLSSIEKAKAKKKVDNASSSKM